MISINLVPGTTLGLELESTQLSIGVDTGSGSFFALGVLATDVQSSNLSIGLIYGGPKSLIRSVALALPEAAEARVLRTGPAAPSLGRRTLPDWQASAAHFLGQITVANQHYYEHGPMSITHRIFALEGDDITVRGRPVTEDGTALLQANISTILLNIFDTTSSTSATAIHTETLPVDQMFFSSLQITKGWRKDAIGYSFEHQVDGAALVEGGRVYRLEYVFGLSAGGSIKHAVEVAISGLLTPSSELGS